MSVPTAKTIEVADLLRLTSVAAQGLVGLFLITQAVLAMGTLGDVLVPWISVVALAAMSLGAVVVMRPGGGYPLSGRRTTLVLVAVLVSTAMVTWNLPSHGWPGYASWHLGADTFVLLALGLRGRIALSWVGMAAMAGLSVVWTVTTGQGAIAGINLVDRDAGTLLIGTMFALAFRGTARRVAEFHEADRLRAQQEAGSEAGKQERQYQSTRLKTQVQPVLELVARGGEQTDDQRAGFRVLEASLRDEIRAGALLGEPLISSVRRARERGVDVLLLDDSGGTLPGDVVLREAVAWAAGAVDAIELGHVVVRLRPPRHPHFASVHIDAPEHSWTIEYPQ